MILGWGWTGSGGTGEDGCGVGSALWGTHRSRGQRSHGQSPSQAFTGAGVEYLRLANYLVDHYKAHDSAVSLCYLGGAHMSHGTWHMAHGTWHMAHGTCTCTCRLPMLSLAGAWLKPLAHKPHPAAPQDSVAQLGFSWDSFGILSGFSRDSVLSRDSVGVQLPGGRPLLEVTCSRRVPFW